MSDKEIFGKWWANALYDVLLCLLYAAPLCNWKNQSTVSSLEASVTNSKNASSYTNRITWSGSVQSLRDCLDGVSIHFKVLSCIINEVPFVWILYSDATGFQFQRTWQPLSILLKLEDVYWVSGTGPACLQRWSISLGAAAQAGRRTCPVYSNSSACLKRST